MAKFIKITTTTGREMLLNTEHIVACVKSSKGVLLYLSTKMQGEDQPVCPKGSYEDFAQLLEV